jgi:hypothetical protein
MPLRGGYQLTVIGYQADSRQSKTDNPITDND